MWTADDEFGRHPAARHKQTSLPKPDVAQARQRTQGIHRPWVTERNAHPLNDMRQEYL